MNRQPYQVNCIQIWLHLGSNGKFTQLLKPTRKEAGMNKNEEEKGTIWTYSLKKDNEEKDMQIDELTSKIALFEKENFELLEHRDKLSKLYDLGLVDSAGDPLIAHPDDDIQVEKKEEFIRF